MNEKHNIIIVGDLFPVPSNFSKFSEGNVQYLFGDRIISLFSNADYSICNLEGALTNGNDICEKTGPVVKAPPSTIKALQKLGIDCCTLANNHITDAGHQGVVDTMLTLETANIKHIGAGENDNSIYHYMTFGVGGKKIGLYNVCETMYNEPTKNKAGAFIYDEYIVCREIEELKQGCDYMIVIYHGGAEKFRFPSPQTRKRFHRMVDCGANMILSQHTHCVGSEEYYKDAYLLYGQGNFLFRSFNNDFTDTGLIIELEIDGDSFVVHKHLVNAADDTVRYAESQDFTEFDKRSSLIKDEDYVKDLFNKYCLSELPQYLYAYRDSIIDRILKRFSKRRSLEYLMTKAYSRKKLLFTLHSLRSEQNREVAVTGILELLKKNNNK